MAKQQQVPERPAPRLYLFTPLVADGETLARDLAAVLSADVAAVLLRLAGADERSLINRIKAVAPTVQARGTALVLDGHADLVHRSGADGAHLAGIAAFMEAAASLKPDRIAGCGGLATRHDAMTAGETGADYVMFGEPDADGRTPPFPAVLERVAWWAEVFEPPCVGYAANLDQIVALVSAGADFVALGDLVWADPRGPAAAVRDALAALSAKEIV